MKKVKKTITLLIVLMLPGVYMAHAHASVRFLPLNRTQALHLKKADKAEFMPLPKRLPSMRAAAEKPAMDADETPPSAPAGAKRAQPAPDTLQARQLLAIFAQADPIP
jgi:hypothetical protein